MNFATSRLLLRISRSSLTALSPFPSPYSLLCPHSHNPIHLPAQAARIFSNMPPKKQSKQNGDSTNGETVASDAHQYQSGSTTHRKEDEWKHREPYRIHGDDEEFDVKWRGQCHCGKVQYQLSRDKPLASKYCHCSTCQRLHGVRTFRLSGTTCSC
jgi:hypothetical protein